MGRRKGVMLSIQKRLVQSGGVGVSLGDPSHQGRAAANRHAAQYAARWKDRGDRPFPPAGAHSLGLHPLAASKCV